jgi:GNAT superfamily N-acetyltransferase
LYREAEQGEKHKMDEWVTLTIEDLSECALLYVQVFNSAPWNDQWTVEKAHKRLLDIHDSPGFVGLKFMMEGQIKGAVLGNREQWFKGMHYNLREMLVSNELQGSGFGTQLIHALEKELKGLDVGSIYLFTSKENGTERFYLKNGFSEYGFMVMMGKGVDQDN